MDGVGSRRYTLDEWFFSTWTADMAYVLGFWWADGYMKHDRSYRIRFYSNDIQILEDIAKVVETNMPVRNEYKECDCHNLVMHSKRLYSDLEKLGGISRKSNKLSFPTVPEKFLPDFIRGYFDGDGSVHLISYKATKNGKRYTNIRSNFTCGTKLFLECLRDLLSEKLGLTHKVIGQYGPHQFKLGYGEQDTHRLLHYLYYPGHTIALKRKARFIDRLDKRIESYAFAPKVY